MIDVPTAMVLIGSALQAASPIHRIVTRQRRRRVARAVFAALPFTPAPRTDPRFTLLFASVEAIDRP